LEAPDRSAARPVVTAGFALTWDGRVMERQLVGKGVDAVLSDIGMPSVDGAAARVVITAGRMDARATGLGGSAAPLIIYSGSRMPRATQATLAGLPWVRVHLTASGEWALGDVLAHLFTEHGMRRVAVELSQVRFRELANGGLLDELRIGWRACIAGGKALLPMTGLDEEFLPRGIALDLVKLARGESEYVASYRVRGSS
jgi:riboflavin biosynthesis pyrimidine reductase